MVTHAGSKYGLEDYLSIKTIITGDIDTLTRL
jgi:hypothetical protein